MYLKSIEVHGFKSFANKITFQFNNGITGIVGPNGSGKSNVADAVRWVLGEQSAKQLRGANMQDVIFSGTQMRKSLGFAYVAITLDNSDHKLAIDYEEVTVARRVYRSGESEYMINGTNCRLRDVQELFMDTGIGKEGYSIIGQGQIDKILSGKPEERRELFDEAAGIVKFKKRKAVAERDLEAERLNLSRVTDIITEIERQIGPLEKQSEVAKEYLRLKEQLKRFEVNQFLIEYEKNNQLKIEVDQKAEIVSNDFSETQIQFEKIKKEYEKLELELEEINQGLEEAKNNRNELQLSIEKTEGEIKVLKEQVAAITQNETSFQSRIDLIKSNAQKKAEELEGYRKEKLDIDQKLRGLEEKKSSSNEAMLQIEERMQDFTKEIEACNNEIFRILNENSNIKTNLQRYETISEQNSIKKAEINQKILKIKSEESSLSYRLEELKSEAAHIMEQIDGITSDNQSLVKQIEELQKKIDAGSVAAGQKNQAYLSMNAKLDSLRNLTERYDGYGNSIRRIMEQKDHMSGIIGVVADIVKVDKNYETAIETALGGNIQNVVTDNEDTAKKLIEFLKSGKHGRATFLPLTSISGNATGNEQVLKEEGVIGLAHTLVNAESRFDNLLKYLLGRTYVVDNIYHAIAISKKYKYSLRIVTLEGEQLNPGGSLSGGAYKNSSNLLSRRREIEELEENVLTLKEEVAKLTQDILSYKEQRLSMREVMEANQKKLSDLSVEANTAKLNIRQEQEKKDSMHRTYLEFVNELKLIEDQNTELKAAIEKLKNSLLQNDKISKEKEQRIEECNQNLSNERANQQTSQEEASKILVETSNLEQSIQYVQENMRRVRYDIETLEAEEQELRREGENSTEQKNTREAQIADSTKKQQEEMERLRLLEETIKDTTNRKEVMSQNHKGFFKQREELQNRLGVLDKESFRLQNQKEKLSEVLDAQISYMWEEYELTVSTAAEYQDEELCNPVSNKKGITDLKNSIKSLGDVNVNAIEDYKNLSERYEFLTTQKADLIAAEETLQGIIAELDEEMRRQFEEKFADIKEQFDIVFKELFGGGKGTLELTEEEDILEAGIRIIAQPPGKKLQNMMQLSGGEKALTAISLLFAIQNLKPSPFCLLDEIEAALDDSNVKRFANYLHKLIKDTQFIIITHRRGTMAAADVLYGITMQEKGVSTLVSVSLIEENLDS